MSRNDKGTVDLIVEVIGTLVGLAIVGAIAWGMLYIKGRATPTNSLMVAMVLAAFAISILGGRFLGRSRTPR